MTTEKKFVHLSSKNLDKVYEWVEKNERKSRLAKTYMHICACIGELDGMRKSMLELIYYDGVKCAYSLPEDADESMNRMIEIRDTLGRTILKVIKDQEPRK